MSNTEMVSELLPCPFCGQQDFLVERLDSDASVVICQGLTGPHEACLARGPVGVAQNEGEEQPGRNKAVELWNARAEQHQGEPVAKQKPVMRLECEKLLGGDGEYAVDFVKPGWLQECREKGGTFLLYTHADAGEVGRLRKELIGRNAQVVGLRAQLAERDALLRDLEGKTILSWPDKRRISAALSASAEPNECRKCGSLTAEKCQAGCWFERDEQAAFKAHFADYLSGANKLGTSYNNPIARGMEIGWMARAGVPGKPSQP